MLTSISGADVSGVEPTGTIDLGEKRRQFVSSLAVNNLDFSRTIYMHPKILIVALNGPAVGLSAAIIAHADFIYAAPHAYVLTPFSSLGLVAEGGASRAFVKRLGISKANKALLMGKRIQSEELLSTGFIDKIISVASGSQDDSEGFLKAVLAEVDDALGPHLHDWSLLKTKELIRQPEREILDKQNILEMYGALHTLVAGIPQEEFRKLATGQKKHKL
jgi:peroxisomal 3,2-trans-enoyl-CoA isomerase